MVKIGVDGENLTFTIDGNRRLNVTTFHQSLDLMVVEDKVTVGTLVHAMGRTLPVSIACKVCREIYM